MARLEGWGGPCLETLPRCPSRWRIRFSNQPYVLSVCIVACACKSARAGVWIAMPEIAKPKTFREFIDFCNTLPRGRRIFGYVSTIGSLVFLTGLMIAIYFKTGFLSYLVLAFLMFISTTHSNYALAESLTQRKVRKIDYWYVGAAAIGLLLFAAGYSYQRELVLTRLFVAAHQSGEVPVREKVVLSLTNVSNFLCSTEMARSSRTPCEGAKRFAAEIKPHLTVDQIKALGDMYDKWVTLPYGQMFSLEQLQQKPELFSPVVIVKIRLDDWAEYMRNPPQRTVSPRDEEAEILFGLGQLVIWPFFLAYALALRITKVTVDVFEWAK